MIVIFEHRFRLGQSNVGQKCDSDPVVNHSRGDGNFMIVFEHVKLFEIKFAAAELLVNFLAA